MELTLNSVDGSAGKLDVSEKLFAADFNEPLIHQVVVSYLAGARAGTKAQKNRSAVRGGGAKPWRQKGTGRARAGTIRSPLWRTGGKTFAAQPRDHSVKVNRKMYRGAMGSILSELVRQDRLLVIDRLQLAEARTKLLVEVLGKLDVQSCLLVTDELDEKLYLAARNLVGVEVIDVDAVDPVALIASDKVIITEAAVKKIQEKLS